MGERAGIVTKQENRRYYLEVEDYDWVQAAEKWVGLETLFHRMREKALVVAVKKWGKPEGKFLDAGCGTGLILKHLPAGSVGVDLNPRHLIKAKVYAPGAELTIADIERLPFGDESFETVISGSMLGQLLNPEPGVRELKRVLKPGGRLIALVSGQSPLWRLRWLSKGPKEPMYRLFKFNELVNLLVDRLGMEMVHTANEALGMEILMVARKKVPQHRLSAGQASLSSS